jgi:hypothetical protein
MNDTETQNVPTWTDVQRILAQQCAKDKEIEAAEAQAKRAGQEHREYKELARVALEEFDEGMLVLAEYVYTLRLSFVHEGGGLDVNAWSAERKEKCPELKQQEVSALCRWHEATPEARTTARKAAPKSRSYDRLASKLPSPTVEQTVGDGTQAAPPAEETTTTEQNATAAEPQDDEAMNKRTKTGSRTKAAVEQEAKDILAEARAEAKRIRAEARKEARGVQAEARKEGRAMYTEKLKELKQKEKAFHTEVGKAAQEKVKALKERLDRRERGIAAREKALHEFFKNKTGRKANDSVLLLLDNTDFKRLRSNLHPDKYAGVPDDLQEKLNSAMAVLLNSTFTMQ